MYRDLAPQDATILVVEDSSPIRSMVCAMLTQTGYRCLEASDGAEALEVLKDGAGDVQLVLTDVVMPNMNGAELAEHLSKTRPNLRILFMSGYSDDSLVNSISRAPLFLPKPFTAMALMEKVRQALESDSVPVPRRSRGAGPA